jgi:hypothetical protein
MFSNEQISEVLGTRALDTNRHRNLNHLATATADAHWHVNDLPWKDMPLFPLPENITGRRLKAFVEFGKRAIRAQLAAEHVAVAAARHLLLRAEKEGMHMSVRRAIAAVLNDEASHVLVMTEMDARAEDQFPDIPLNDKESPLLPAFRDAVNSLHPGLVSAFMGAYEAMIAIRGYAEQASYSRPSILSVMAGHAAEDDGRHAKVMRLAAHEWLDKFRAELAPSESTAMLRQAILDPIRNWWALLLDHEYWLLQYDPRQRDTLQRRVKEDINLGERVMKLLGFSEEELDYVHLTSLMQRAELLPA